MIRLVWVAWARGQKLTRQKPETQLLILILHGLSVRNRTLAHHRPTGQRYHQNIQNNRGGNIVNSVKFSIFEIPTHDIRLEV